MAKPRPPRPSAQAGLDEVERAISALSGRHPEHERSRRETAVAAEKRRVELAVELEASARRRRRRALVIAANTVAVGVAGFVGYRLFVRASTLRHALAAAEAPFEARGLVELASNAVAARTRLEAATPGAGCYVALSTTGRVRALVGGAELPGGRSVGWCGCAAGPVTVSVEGATESAPGLALLRIDGEVVGGPLAGAAAALGAEAWRGADLAHSCEEAMLDGWIARDRPPGPVPSHDDFVTLAGGPELLRAGLVPRAALTTAAQFVVVEQGEGECLVAFSDSGRLSLRLAGGARPVDGVAGALAWCGHAKATVTVWRAGEVAANAIVATVPAARIGGLFGTREALSEAGFRLAAGATGFAEGAMEQETTAILKASTLLDAKPTQLPVDPAPPDPHPAILAFAASGRVSSSPADALLGCEPPLQAGGDALGESVCATAGPSALWRAGAGPAFAARADPPIWLSALTAQGDPGAFARVPAILALARRLARGGFESTILEGVTELDEGVRIAGRAGEDAVVALGVSGKAPWVFPYSDGPRWTLGGAPRVVRLAPGASVTLTANPLPTAPLDKRRTVVFRRSAGI